MKRYEINHFEYVTPKIGPYFDGIKFVVLSDLHNNSYQIDLEQLFRDIVMEKPDYILIAGDMYNGEPNCTNAVAEAFLIKLSQSFPVFYGMGNHEYRMMAEPDRYPGGYSDFAAMIRKTGITLLQNESVCLTKGDEIINISSVMIGKEYYKKLKREPMPEQYMKKTLEKPKNDGLQILIAHHPNYFRQYADWGADVVISGHVHGGMARLPVLGGLLAPNYRLLPHYDKGRFDEFGATMFLSAGIGTHTINLRPFNPPEMLVLKLKTTLA